MKRRIPYLACIALVFSFTVAFAQNNSSNTQRSEKTESTKRANFDQNFVKQAAQGNMAEIQMAQLAEQKATDPKVKELAKTIAQDHKQAQEKLEQIAQTQNVSIPTQLPEKVRNEHQKLSSMSGQQFDHAYLQMMVREHKKDIKEFQRASKMASDSDVKQYATSTLPDLQKHLQMAQQVAGQTGTSTQAHE